MHVPAHIRRRVRAIDADLDVEVLRREDKYAIVQRLYNTPSIEDLVAQVATEAYATLLDRGYCIPKHYIEAALYPNVCETTIVMRVENRDGSYRPIDERTFAVLREMAWNRRHRSVQDWMQAGDLLTYEAKRSRARAKDTIWSGIRTDKVLHRCMSNALAGLRPTRSVLVGDPGGTAKAA